MKDEEIESLMGRYRPIARTPALRAAQSPRAWPWAVAAAALLAITIGLHARVVPAPEPSLDPARVHGLTEQLGGSADARALAESIVRAEEERDAARAATLSPAPGGMQ